VSADGQWLACGGTDGTVRLWETASGKEVLRRPGHEFWIMSLAFSPDGRTLASSGYDGVSLLWDLRPKSELPAGGVKSLWDVLGDECKEAGGCGKTSGKKKKDAGRGSIRQDGYAR